MVRTFSVFKILLLTIVLHGTALAEPRIVALSGQIAHGSEVTIDGILFGDNGDEVPIKFDDFENGDVGRELSAGGWSVTSDNGPSNPVYSQEHSFSGVRSGYADITAGGDSAAFLTGINATRLYVSFRFRFRLDGSPTTQKGFRTNANDGPNIYTSRPNVNVQDFATGSRLTISPNDDVNGKYSFYDPPNISQDSWHRLEYYFVLSEPAGSDNGEVWAWHDLDEVTRKTGINTRGSGVPDRYQTAMMPFFIGNGGGGELWYDDAYISKSRARVEIGNDPVWENCTRRSIQNITDWSGSSIVFRANLFGFAGSDDRYIFVVDGEGQASAGLKLEDVVRPNPPGGVN